MLPRRGPLNWHAAEATARSTGPPPPVTVLVPHGQALHQHGAIGEGRHAKLEDGEQDDAQEVVGRGDGGGHIGLAVCIQLQPLVLLQEEGAHHKGNQDGLHTAVGVGEVGGVRRRRTEAAGMPAHAFAQLEVNVSPAMPGSSCKPLACWAAGSQATDVHVLGALDEPQAAPQVGASQLPNRGAVAAGEWVPSAEEGPQAR